MHNQVIAHIEIEDHTIEYYTSVILRQHFNAHHEFEIRIRYDVLEKQGSFNMDNTQKLIGKSAIIKLIQADDLQNPGDPAHEFRGIICEIIMEQSEDFTRNLVLKGYSPTILLENGFNYSSFYESDLKKIVQKVTKALSQNNCTVNLKPRHTKQEKYICQYNESGFHFLNRLSSDYSEWFYYDGKELNFGKPSSSPNIDITYGEDVNNIQFKLRLLPMAFSSYSYVSKDDKLISTDAPANIGGLDQQSSYVLKESNKIFSEPVTMPLRQRIESKSELDGFVEKQKAALAGDIEVLTGSSHNPAICIGTIASLQVTREEGGLFLKEERGKFLITGVNHHIEGNAKYHNTFEAIPSTLEVVPVKNIIAPIAETQVAIVKDNKDPLNNGRVRAQMQWQQGNDMTDWIRVMTPDAGGGKGGAKNRGMVCVPETGDQVLISFQYNNPDKPFVLGSMFHGKTGGGGGKGNNTKSINSKSGHTISLDDGKGISIVDKSGGNKIEIDGTNLITITASQKIELTNGKSSITMDGDTITISAAHIKVEGSTDSSMTGGEHGFSAASGGDVSVTGKDVSVSGKKTIVNGSSEATVTGAKATVNGDTEATFNSGGKTTVSAGGKVAVQGALVALN